MDGARAAAVEGARALQGRVAAEVVAVPASARVVAAEAAAAAARARGA